MDPDEGVENLSLDLEKGFPFNDDATQIFSVDPLQPNIAYRDPDTAGYHSRCSSAYTDVQRQSIPRHLSQGISIGNEFYNRSSGIKSPHGYTKTDYGRVSPFLDQAKLQNYNSFVNPALTGQRTPEGQRPSSQQRRHQEEHETIDKIKAMKRLAQVVPHRIDVPYYMSGRGAKLCQRYHLSDLEKSRLLQASYRKPRDSASSSRHSASSAGGSSRNKYSASQRSRIKEVKDVTSRPNSPVLKRTDREEKFEEAGRKDESKAGDQKTTKLATPVKDIRKLGIKRSTESTEMDDPFHLESLDHHLSAGDTSVLSIVSKRQKIAFEGIFNDIDFDSNGKVSFNELMHGLFANISKKDAKALMKIFDIDKNKVIDRREFVAVCALNDRLCGIRTVSQYDCLRLDIRNLAKHIELYKALFDMLDADGDRKIHVDEIMLIMSTAMGKEIGTDQEIARSVMKSLDKDDNEYVLLFIGIQGLDTLWEKYKRKVSEQLFYVFNGYIDFVNFLSNIPFFLRLHNSMMSNDEIKLGDIIEIKEDIKEKLKQNSPS